MKHLFTAMFTLLLCFTMQPSHSLTQDTKITQDKPTMVKLYTNKGNITLQLDAENQVLWCNQKAKSLLQIHKWDAAVCRDEKFYRDRIKRIPDKFSDTHSWTTSFIYHIFEDMRASLQKELEGSRLSRTDFYLDSKGQTRRNNRRCSVASSESSAGCLVIIVKQGNVDQFSGKHPNFIASMGQGVGTKIVDEYNMVLSYAAGTHQDEFEGSNGIGWDLYKFSTPHIPSALSLSSLKRCATLEDSSLVEEILNCSPCHRDNELSARQSRNPVRYYHSLNASQDLAISTILGSLDNSLNISTIRTQKASVKIIHGPPGTGKTATLVALIDALLQKRIAVLATAPSNHAICELARRCFSHLFSSPRAARNDRPKRRDVVLVGREDKLILSPELEIIHVDHIIGRLTDSLVNWSTTFDHLRTLLRDKGVVGLSSPEELTSCLTLCLKYCVVVSDHLPPRHFKDTQSVVFLKTLCTEIETYMSVVRNVGPGSASKVLKLIESQDFKSVTAVSTSAYKLGICGESRDEDERDKIAMAIDIVSQAIIVFSTVDSSCQRAVMKKDFQVAIIDEAAQLVESRICMVLFNNLQCLVLAGDNKQLPPTVISSLAKKMGYDRSLLDRLLQNNFPSSLLDTQYRMHPKISEFPNRRFYENKLINGINVESDSYTKPWHHFLPPFSVYDVEGEEVEDEKRSYWNATECRVMKEVVKTLDNILISHNWDTNCPLKVGVISPYNAQLKKIGAAIESIRRVCISVIYNTVDGFQGQECDVIIFLCVRSNKTKKIGFLDDERRLNVAITRAKYSLLLIGNCNTLSSSDVFKDLIEGARRKEVLSNKNSSEIIEKAIQKEIDEKAKLQRLKDPSTSILENTVWGGKFVIMASLKQSLPKITDLNSKNLLWSLLLRLAEGRWPRAIRLPSGIDVNLTNIVFCSSVDGKVLLWSLDITQVMKIFLIILLTFLFDNFVDEGSAAYVMNATAV